MSSKKIRISKKIIGILSCPDHLNITEPGPAVLLLHGFATDKNEVNNLFFEMSSFLEKNGIINLRIDFRGYGETSDHPENATIDTMLSDAVASFNYLSHHPFVDPTAIGMIGFSLGAAIAILATKKIGCNSLALLSPTLNLVNDFNIFLGEEIMAKLRDCNNFIEIQLPWRNIKIGKEFYLSLFNHHPINAIQHYNGSFVCFAGENDFSCANADLIYKKILSLNKYKEIIKGANHIFNTNNNGSKLSIVALKTCDKITKNLIT